MEGAPIVEHLGRVVEKMTIDHEHSPINAFEDVSAAIRQTSSKTASHPTGGEGNNLDENLGYIHDSPEQISDHLAKISSIMVFLGIIQGLRQAFY